MCNEIARRIALGQLRDDWSELKVPLVFPEGLPNLAPLASIRITDPTLILRAIDQGVAATVRRWSWPGPGGRPVYNYRSEGRGFVEGAPSMGSPQSTRLRGGSGRCLIPVDAFYEFTDPAPTDGEPAAKRRRKTKWRFTAAPGFGFASDLRPEEDGWFCIAGFWRTEPALGEGRAGEAFTLLTCDPGPDIAPYHHRQVVLPPREAWAGWLDGSLPASAVCRPTPAGSLRVEQA